jgi:urea transporter
LLSAGVGRTLLVSLGMALAIAFDKIVISILSPYAVVFFRFPFRLTAFWLIFITLMLPVDHSDLRRDGGFRPDQHIHRTNRTTDRLGDRDAAIPPSTCCRTG